MQVECFSPTALYKSFVNEAIRSGPVLGVSAWIAMGACPISHELEVWRPPQCNDSYQLMLLSPR